MTNEMNFRHKYLHALASALDIQCCGICGRDMWSNLVGNWTQQNFRGTQH